MSLEQSLENQLEMVKEIKRTRDEVIEVKDEMAEMYTEVKRELQEIKDTYPLTDGEATLIQSLVGKKAHEFTSEFLGQNVSTDLFMMKMGHFRQGIYTALKKRFNATKYTTIKHIQAKEAYSFIRELQLDHLASNYLRITQGQMETAERYGDKITIRFNRNQMNLLN